MDCLARLRFLTLLDRSQSVNNTEGKRLCYRWVGTFAAQYRIPFATKHRLIFTINGYNT